MRFAVIADVHGNLPALEAVLAGAREHGAEQFIFAGDYCLSGPFPNECVSLIRSVNDRYIVKGNEEEKLKKLHSADKSKWIDGQMEISYFTYRSLSEENLRWLFSLPEKQEISLFGKRIILSHKLSEHMDDRFEVIWSEYPAQEYKGVDLSFERQQSEIKEALDSDEVFQERLNALPDGAYIFGHSHVQWTYRSADGKKLLLNPGSCGLPLDGVKRGAPYALLDIDQEGFSAIEMRADFDTEGYLDTFRKSKMYSETPVWSRVVELELAEKREHIMFFLRFMEEYARSIGDTERPFSESTWKDGFEKWREKSSEQ